MRYLFKLNCFIFQTTWSCSICRRKRQSRTQPIIAQDSTDSMLDVPMLEALQRRHSDVKLGSSTNLGPGTGGASAGLAPPRSPELRRHSDVSPASLKEIEKVFYFTIVVFSFSFRHRRKKGGPGRIDLRKLIQLLILPSPQNSGTTFPP